MDDIDPAGTAQAMASGESRWPPVIAVLVFLVLNVALRIWLPGERPFTLPWFLPVIEMLLVVVLAFGDPTGADRRSLRLRRTTIVLICLLVSGAMPRDGGAHGPPHHERPANEHGRQVAGFGGPRLDRQRLAFALLYWVFDSGGPSARMHRRSAHPDLAFPQNMNPELAPVLWRPAFVDYLYLGFCTSTAFSPTDVMPLAHWTKLAMGAQSAASLTIFGLAIAGTAASRVDTHLPLRDTAWLPECDTSRWDDGAEGVCSSWGVPRSDRPPRIRCPAPSWRRTPPR